MGQAGKQAGRQAGRQGSHACLVRTFKRSRRRLVSKIDLDGGNTCRRRDVDQIGRTWAPTKMGSREKRRKLSHAGKNTSVPLSPPAHMPPPPPPPPPMNPALLQAATLVFLLSCPPSLLECMS
jgi:hypothetical protein